jgi:3-oxoacyl-[acyl-carrier-protein] synthase II
MPELLRRPAVITGIGLMTPLGLNREENWGNLILGRSGISHIKRFDTRGLLTTIGGELPDAFYELEAGEFPRRLRHQTIPTTRLGFLCAKEALQQSGLTSSLIDPYRCAVISGCGQSSFQEGQDAPDSEKYVVVKEMVNAISAWISIKFGFKGPTYNIAAACASGAFACAAGLDFIRSGRGDAAVIVGVDMMLNRSSIIGFNELLALSEQNDSPETACRPFDKRRNGFVLSNGAGALVLESLDSAARRKADILALLTGAGIVSEGYNIVAPEPSGREIAKTMELALADAGLPPHKIGYVNAHGTSTLLNDLSETMAIKQVFGSHALQLAVSSQKSMIGHTIGGAGAIECAVTALTLSRGMIPPTINYSEPDPECDLDYVPNTARPAGNLEAAISNSFGFGGHNCSLILEKFK